jgi:hypothetical protein
MRRFAPEDNIKMILINILLAYRKHSPGPGKAAVGGY